jgi:hypothetical protein
MSQSELNRSEVLNQSQVSINVPNLGAGQFANVGTKFHQELVNKFSAKGNNYKNPSPIRKNSIPESNFFKEDFKNMDLQAPMTERHTEKTNSQWLREDPNKCIDHFFMNEKVG